MSKVEEIANGLKNVVRSKLNLTTEQEETLFASRRKICDACPFNKDNTTCEVCGCILALKTKSINTTCPKGHW